MVSGNQHSFTLKSRGFTLIEFLITVGILLILLSLGPFITTGTLRDYQISQEANYLIDNLRLAQHLSLYQKDDSFFGIRFAKDKYFLIQKSSLQEQGEPFRAHSLPTNFQINGPSEIIFEKMTGKPLWQGVIGILEVNQKGVVFHRREIYINAEGNIETLQ